MLFFAWSFVAAVLLPGLASGSENTGQAAPAATAKDKLDTETEVAPPASLPCFPGAYYRKAVSSMDHWRGIGGVITLPQLTLDDARRKPTGRYLDNPSIYMGGRCGEQEIDAGLTWEVIREPDGSVSKVGKAFRPFWRNNEWHSAPAKPEYYYYPGDTVRMRCAVAGEGMLRISVELLARGDGATTGSAKNEVGGGKSASAGTESSAAVKGEGWWADRKPLSVFSAEFEAPGFGPSEIQQFKRVNAIDQSGNEGKAVQPTKARVEGAVWHAVWLIRGHEYLPMTPTRYTDMRCPSRDHFTVSPAGREDAGGERISIFGDASMKP